MSRYIDDDETLKIIRKMLYETALNNFTTDRKFADDCEEIAEHRLATWIGLVPTADVVEVKHGKWIPIKDDEHWYVLRWECSCCGFRTTSDKMANYCEDCGAKMEDGRGE